MIKLFSFAFFALVMTLPLLSCKEEIRGCDKPPSARLASEEDVVIANGEGSDYVIIFSSDANQLDGQMASSLRSSVRSALGISLSSKPDTVAEKKYEILLGNTNRALSGELLKAVKAYDRDGSELLVWGFMEKDGKLAYTANCAEAFEKGADDINAFITSDGFSVPRDLVSISYLTRAEYEAELKEKEEAEYEALIDALIKKNAEFTLSQFGGSAREIGRSPFGRPDFYPSEGMHPRLLITEGVLDELRNFINSEESAALKSALFTAADSDGCLSGFPINYKNGVLFRYSEMTLAEIEAKALAYLITGDRVYGYEAIIAAKSALLTLVYPKELHMDTYHGASHTMTTAALVYDWCYDLLTESDKAQMIGGVSNLMCPQLEYDLFLEPKPEIGAVSGHGTGPQFLRDYVTVSLAFFDEAPELWEYVGGKFFDDFVPVIEVCYEGGWGSQGSGGYGTSKYYLYTWAAYVIKTATGEMPYKNIDGARLSAHFWQSHLTSAGTYFQSGDTTAMRDGIAAEWFYLFPAAALYSDEELAYAAYRATDGYERYFYNFSHAVTPALMTVFASAFPDFDKNAGEIPDTVQYFSSPAGQMTARSEWGEGGAVAFMKIGEMTMGNHDNYDHGTFQIYYKGLLAASSGSYDKYASDSHRYYRQSTVAHNGLLIFNPKNSDKDPIIKNGVITNAARYYYSGSQRRREEAATMDVWLSGEYELGEVTGVSYACAEGKSEYAYIAGDITKAYPSDTVDYVGRRMLTVFTGDDEAPMLFFTFDSADAKSADFRRTFLLHTVDEPTVDEKTLTAEVLAKDGRLVLHSVAGADTIMKIGGSGYAYWISDADYVNPDGTPSGKNCTDAYTVSDRADTVWGRIELSRIGEKRTDMLTAMYVTDKNSDKRLPVSRISSDTVEGAAVGDVFAVFVKSAERAYDSFGFETVGEGLFDYYISGVETGTWRVLVDGVGVASVYSDDDGGFVRFSAPAGRVTLVPCGDVIGSNGGRIVYETGGAVLPSGAPTVYKNDEQVSLPEDLTRGNDVFVGWYTSSTFEEGTRVEKTPLGGTGTLKLYARWLSELFCEDYSRSEVNVSGKQGAVGGVTYNASSKVGASFVTGSDESGRFLTWRVGENDPHFHYINYGKNISTSSADDMCVTFTVSFSPSEGVPMPSSDFRIISKSDVNGNEIPSKRIGIFRIAEGDGDVYIGDTNTKIAECEDGKITTLRLVLDFKSGRILSYDGMGDLCAFTSFSVPSGTGAESTAEWMKCFNSYVFYWYGHSSLDGAAMRVYSIKVEEGNRVLKEAEDSNKISYVLGGGSLPEGAPRSYSDGEATPLPTPTRENSKFYGWYTDESFSEKSRTEEVPKGTTGVYTVYAKWGTVYVDAKYNEGSLEVTEANKYLDGITYKSKDNVGASFITRLDENGDAYVEWTKGESDPFMHAQSAENNFATSSDTAFSYTLSLRSISGKNPIGTDLRIISKVNAEGASVTSKLTVLKTDTEGRVTLGDGDDVVAMLSDNNITTVRIVVDFAEAEIKAYGERGDLTARCAFSPPANTGAKTALEWQRLFTSYLLYWYGGIGDEDSSLAIYRIIISEGNVFER